MRKLFVKCCGRCALAVQVNNDGWNAFEKEEMKRFQWLELELQFTPYYSIGGASTAQKCLLLTSLNATGIDDLIWPVLNLES